MKKIRLPIFKERLKELGEWIGAGNKSVFADMLGIHRDTLRQYLDGDRLPDAQTLKQIAQEGSVSADWLLGLTSVRQADVNLRTACDYTGLSEAAVEELRSKLQPDITKSRDAQKLISEMLSNELFYEIFSLMNDYIETAVTAAENQMNADKDLIQARKDRDLYYRLSMKYTDEKPVSLDRYNKTVLRFEIPDCLEIFLKEAVEKRLAESNESQQAEQREV